MKFTVVTLFPEVFMQALKMGVVGQAIDNGLLQIQCITPREFTKDIHKTVDDRPFGGGDGMLMMCEPLALLMESLGARNEYHSIYMSPQGKSLNHAKVVELSQSTRELVIICGRYGGIDQRFINDFVDEEISIGDFVLSGGEIPALAVIDAIGRQIPGVLGHQDSASYDSFANGLLEAPQFTRPREWRSCPVPEVLLSGNHEKINAFRKCLGYLISFKKRRELIEFQLRKSALRIKEKTKFLEQLEEVAQLTDLELQALGITRELIAEFKNDFERF